jgi:hypothetical protein
MIDKRLLRANAPSNIGDQIHINHTGCSSGEDTKKRLYIKKTAGGILAYCHHCSEHGFIKDPTVDGERLSSWLHGKRSDVPSISSHGPEMFVRTDMISHQGAAWLMKYDCDHLDTKFFDGVKGHPNKVYLRLYNPDFKAIGYQIRHLNPLTKPKYLTGFLSGIDHRGDASWFTGNKNTLVITEDYLSAYRVWKDTGLTAVALLKTSISDRTLQQIAAMEPEFINIWLDPDAAGIKGTTEAMDKLQFFLKDETILSVIGVDAEPKQCSPGVLRDTLL